MRTVLWLSWHVRACEMATGWNAPQGVEKAALRVQNLTGKVLYKNELLLMKTPLITFMNPEMFGKMCEGIDN